jgi:hypothetical protein
MGTHTTTFTVTACLDDSQCKSGVLAGSPATITVNYQVGTHVQQDTVMPALAISGTSGHVILRGSAFTGVTGVKIGTNVLTGVAVVNDTEIHADYSAMTAGSMAVTLQKGAANTAFGAGFIVADPVAPAAATLALPATAGTNYIIDSVDFDELHGARL